MGLGNRSTLTLRILKFEAIVTKRLKKVAHTYIKETSGNIAQVNETSICRPNA